MIASIYPVYLWKNIKKEMLINFFFEYENIIFHGTNLIENSLEVEKTYDKIAY
jgi:hypothetical protein